jgi:23S rRNA (cytidine1920-2'-O)/16S rRNA (cytidine1409-2'-O)-methyltransferase
VKDSRRKRGEVERAASRRRAKPNRLDERLVADGLAESRTRSQALIRSGCVLVDDVPVDKPGTRVAADARVRVRDGGRRFVSRGGEKLAGALGDLGLDPRGAVCLDLGASTGGFTDCLLQAGAERVVAVDVGYGQLAARLRGDPRVRVVERTNARHLERRDVPEDVDLVCVDVSFISARLLLPGIAAVAPRASLLVLVKPQFEVGREQVGRGGVVRDDGLRTAAVDAVAGAAGALGYRERGRADSRLPGPRGNREVFLWLEPPGGDTLLSSPD